jgi:N-acetylneuraminic acid mutarotase
LYTIDYHSLAKISNRIEYFNEAFSEWSVLNVRLPFPLEGLSSINLSDMEVLIVGGKGQDGSKKEVIRYTWKELEDDLPTQG